MSDLYVIVGLGATGLSVARYLQSCGVPFAVVDSREHPPQLDVFEAAFPGIPLSLGSLDSPFLDRATSIVLSPGVALSSPPIAKQLAAGKQVIGDIELFARAVKVPVIAITGTNAKSTVTTLVGLMAKEVGLNVAVGGNLGVPVLDLWMQQPHAELFVLELSSFQLETTDSLSARVATVLNVTPDHLDRYASVSDYQHAKHRIYERCEVAVCNRDDPLTDTPAKQKVTFTLQTPQKNEFGLMSVDQAIYLAFEETPLIPVSALPVMGKHYQANALASLAMGQAMGWEMARMLHVLRTFKGLPHRCEFIRERLGVRWYNDSKGTNVGATQAAIAGLGSEMAGKLILIAGGVGKSADFTPMVPLIEKYVRQVVLVGEAAKEIHAAINGRVMTSFATSMEEAILQCASVALPGDSVLLSPACASFDMFKNFEHRGEVFTEKVKQLTD